MPLAFLSVSLKSIYGQYLPKVVYISAAAP